MDDVIVRVEHTRKLRYCARGVREGFARYGLDYEDFLKNGILASVLLEKTGNDWMAASAVEVARGEQ